MERAVDDGPAKHVECTMKRKTALLVALLATIAVPAFAQDDSSSTDPRFRSRVEVGFLDVLSHKIQYGNDGTYINYVEEGGQDVLFMFMRASIEARFNGRHHVSFLYQPLQLKGEAVTTRELKLDDVTFPEGTAIDAKYGFPFYRVSYMYDVLPSGTTELGLGASLQLRNATIVFTSVDGSLRHYERDVGPVPILKLRFRKDFANDTFFEAEADGFYAPIKYLNGGASDVVGAIADVSVRYGFELGRTEAFLNARYLGGGAEGTSDESEFGDGFTKNWLHFATISLGFTYDL